MAKTVKVLVAAILALGALNAWAGQTSGGNKNATRQSDSRDCGCGGSSKSNPTTQSIQNQSPPNHAGNSVGMPTYSFASMLASLSVKDTPISYTPRVGPSLDTTLYYNQRDVDQPLTFSSYNVSHAWTMNWLTYIQDNPAAPGTGVMRYVAGGGADNYAGYDASTGAFTPQLDGDELVMTSQNPVTYELLQPDGSKEVFSASDHSTIAPRRIFLTAVVDPQGNAVTLTYDSQMRLTSVTDAIGQSLTFQYADAADPLQVTGITDPFGRHASIGYNSQGELDSITDELGMTSTFAYGPFPTPPPVIGTADATPPPTPAPSGALSPPVNTDMVSMTTPYGTTSFSDTVGSYGDATELSIQATDPLGYASRTEYHVGAPGVPFSMALVPSGMSVFNAYLNYRDSFYWDKDEFAAACSGRGVTLECDYS